MDAKASLGIFLPLHFDGAGQPRPGLRCGLDRDLDVMVRSDLEVGHSNLFLLWYLFILSCSSHLLPTEGSITRVWWNL
jgi:hypothetical protein